MLLCSNLSYAQVKELKKADDLYENYKYNVAIPYYEAYLAEEPTKKVLAVKTKLAYCYRMTGKSDKAEELYAVLSEEPRVRPIVFFYYGESKMANGKYEEAKVLFEKYQELEPEDDKVAGMIKACEMVKSIKPYFLGVELNALSINTDADDFSPVLYEDGLAFLSDQGDKGRTYGWTGRSYLKLYKTLGNNGAGDFQEIEEFSKKINEYNKNTGPVSISRDGEMMIITRNADEGTEDNKFNLQLFEVKRKGDSWGRGTVLPFCQNNRNYMHPALSYTGDTLYFVSDKGGGFGGTDLFMTYRTPRGWKAPTNLGNIVNSSGHEAFPFVYKDGTLFFASKGHMGFGGFDIFKAVQEDGVYTKVINLGSPINGPKDDTGLVLTDDGNEGYFASSRKAGNDDIYRFVISNGMEKGGEGRILTNKFEAANEIMEVSFNSADLISHDEEALIMLGANSLISEKSGARVVFLEGKVIDAVTNLPLSSVNAYLENGKGEKVKDFVVDENGSILDTIEQNKSYSIVIKKEGYRTKTLFIDTEEITDKLVKVLSLEKE